MEGMDDGDGIVCRVMPDGEVVCENVPPIDAARHGTGGIAASHLSASSSPDQPFIDGLPDGNWGPNKVRLAHQILQLLAQSSLPDSPNVPRRSGEILETVKLLLDPTPPSIVLYNYSTQPANVMGAWFLNKADLVRMQEMLQLFQHPKVP